MKAQWSSYNSSLLSSHQCKHVYCCLFVCRNIENADGIIFPCPECNYKAEDGSSFLKHFKSIHEG